MKQWAIPEDQYAAWLKKQRGAPVPPVRITAVEVDAGSIDPRRLEGRVQSRPGQPLDLSILQKDLERIHELDLFDSVNYELVPDGDGARLKIRAIPSVRATDTIRFGMALNTDFKGNSSFDFLSGLNLREMNRLGGEWKTEIIIGNTIGIGTEFYQPLSYSAPFFAAPRVAYSRQSADYFLDDQAVANYRTEYFHGGLDLGMAIGKVGELRVGYDGGHLKFEKRLGSPVLPDSDEDTGAIIARASFDQLDKISFPHSGYYAYTKYTGSRESLGATNAYDKLEGGLFLPKTFGPQTWALTVFGGDSLGSTIPIWNQFSLGGFRRLSGLLPNQLSGQTEAFASLTTYRKVGTLGMLGGIYLGASFESGNVWKRDGAGDLLRNADRGKRLHWPGQHPRPRLDRLRARRTRQPFRHDLPRPHLLIRRYAVSLRSRGARLLPRLLRETTRAAKAREHGERRP